MIILALILILAGSLGGAALLWLQGAPWWQVALAYVAGGWAGLLGSGLGMGVAQALARARRTGSSPSQTRHRPHQQKPFHKH